MNDELKKIEKLIINSDFYIWLFCRYDGKTAKAITDVYRQRKTALIIKYIELNNEINGVDDNEDIQN